MFFKSLNDVGKQTAAEDMYDYFAGVHQRSE